MADKGLDRLVKRYRSAYAPKVDTGDVRFADVVDFSQSMDSLSCDVAIVGIPQDIGVQRNGGRIGASMAPNAIRDQFYKLTISRGVESLPPECRIADVGNVQCDNLTLEDIHDASERVVAALLRTASLVVVLGGGHDIAYPNGKALSSRVDSMGVINIDAHLDVRPLVEYEGQLVRHSGSGFRQLLEDPTVRIPEGCFTEFGIQPFVAAAAHTRYVLERGHNIMMLNDARASGVLNSFTSAINSSSDAQALYCSFDIDSVQSASAPGVSAPAVDGFSADEILRCAERIGQETRCNLADIVECNPSVDIDNRTSRLCAQLMARLIYERARVLFT